MIKGAADTQSLELSSLQRGLVDNCFEEGQYEMAIATLDQLRSEKFSPWPPHVRQLVYISLYRTQELSSKNDVDAAFQTSPSKFVKQQQHSTHNNITPNIVMGAQRLLMSYLNTYPPPLLLRALPQRKAPLTSKFGRDEGDSSIARQSVIILQCKDCWELLSSGFTFRQNNVLRTPRKERRHSTRANHHNQHDDMEDPKDAQLVPVSDNAWALLDWLISLFERDKEFPQVQGHSSPLFSEQIIDDTGKAYLDIPVNIVIHCLRQKEPPKQRLASRLLSLLVNLTRTPSLDIQTLVIALYSCLSTCSPKEMDTLFSQMDRSIPNLEFTIALCHSFLHEYAPKKKVSSIPRPQPRLRARTNLDKTVDSSENRNPIGSPQSAKPSIPAAAEILRLFEASFPEDALHETSIPTALWYKYRLLTDYGILQMRLDVSARDPDWSKLLDDDLLSITRNVLQQRGPGADMYLRLLESQIIVWQRGRIHS